MPRWLSGLDVISAEFVITAWVVVGALLVVAIFLLHRGWRRWAARRRLTLTGLAGTLVALAAVVAVAASFNAYYAFLPTVDDVVQAATGDQAWVNVDKLARLSGSTADRASENGLVVKQSLPADQANGFGATTNIVYLPPQYFSDLSTDFPVLYLFHGSPGQPQDWFHAGDAEQTAQAVARAGRPVIVVAPQMSRSWTDDPECVDGAQEKVESHLFEQVIPMIDSKFRVDTARQDTIFGGMSAGGYCALNLGMRHRGSVATIIDLSGDTMPTHSGGAGSLFGRTNPQRSSLVSSNSPDQYASSLSDDPPTRIWLDSGTEDHGIVTQMTSLDRTLQQRGIDTVWRVRPGGHTYWVWTKALREALPWALGCSVGPIKPASKPGPT